MLKLSLTVLLTVSFAFACSSISVAQNPVGSPPTSDPAKAGPYDNGKMWTFEYPPLEYFKDTYQFEPDTAWFRKARLSALRIPGCSASFVSPNGLIATNHHCARGSVVAVEKEGEHLLDNGFYAPSLPEERKIPNYYADQLVAIEDVTDRIQQAVDRETTPEARARVRESMMEEIERTFLSRYTGSTDSFVVEVVSLYQGGRFSAYTFRRYTDLRLVAAPEEQLGYFGGDEDNFTYPRYDLDFSLMRIYGADGQPLKTEHYFPLSRSGVQPDDIVFVIGNPGSTNRLETVDQLAFRRDVSGPALIQFLRSRIDVLRAFEKEFPEEAARRNIRNGIFSLSNSLKAYSGRQSALLDSLLFSRRIDNERLFLAALERDEALKNRYGSLIPDMAEVQTEKTRLARDYGALLNLGNPSNASATFWRSLLAYRLRQMGNAGPDADLLAEFRKVRNQPEFLDVHLFEARLNDLVRYYGTEHTVVKQILKGRSAAEAARAIVTTSVFSDSAGAAQAFESGSADNDPMIAVAGLLLPLYSGFQARWSEWMTKEQDIGGMIGRARFDVYGTRVPPDATFSLRITDGVVRGYEYNGTIAPPYTTFYGMYDRYHSFGPNTSWDLPARWLNPPPTFDRQTPLNFVSTSDTIGGNSGSPIVNRSLELVGLNFDRNVEGLSRDFIYLPERGRNMGADVRAILESLDEIMDADRLVRELTTGTLVPTEQEADRM